jgi:regulatory protein
VEREKPKKYVSKADALKKLQKYCAYQDRCHQEVRQKLLNLGIYGDDLEEIVYDLIQENFLNEERFARSYARGKFRHKQWGRQKIRQELKKRDISAYCIKQAMQEIDDEYYPVALTEVLEKYLSRQSEPNLFKRRQKMIAYGIRRGFEYELVQQVTDRILEKDAK